MEIKILEKRENPLLHRVEVKFEISHPKSATPSRDEVRNLLAANLNADKSRVVLDKIITPFGSMVSEGIAKIYDSVEDAKKVEPEYVLIRNKIVEKKEEE